MLSIFFVGFFNFGQHLYEQTDHAEYFLHISTFGSFLVKFWSHFAVLVHFAQLLYGHTDNVVKFQTWPICVNVAFEGRIITWLKGQRYRG